MNAQRNRIFRTARPLLACAALALGLAFAGDARKVTLHITAAPARDLSALHARETVVLIHGLGRTHRSMSALADALSAEGYAVINCSYPSRAAPVEALATELFAALAPHLASAARVHVVTHSMGGLLLRAYLRDRPIPNLGRVVMLAPPSGGSEVVDRLGPLAPFAWLNGPAGRQLGTGANSLPARLPPPAFELGVIAGDRSVNPLLSLLIPGRDDGKVAVARARVAGMRDFLRVHATHTFMMRSPRVIAQAKAFLRSGRFARGGSVIES